MRAFRAAASLAILAIAAWAPRRTAAVYSSTTNIGGPGVAGVAGSYMVGGGGGGGGAGRIQVVTQPVTCQ
jgi:hypothetical protein